MIAEFHCINGNYYFFGSKKVKVIKGYYKWFIYFDNFKLEERVLIKALYKARKEAEK